MNTTKIQGNGGNLVGADLECLTRCVQKQRPSAVAPGRDSSVGRAKLPADGAMADAPVLRLRDPVSGAFGLGQRGRGSPAARAAPARSAGEEPSRADVFHTLLTGF